jgi:hypothetical protein
VNSGNLVYCSHHFPARKGTQWVDLTGNTDNGSPVGLQQTILTTPGATYQLALYVGNVVDTGVCGTTSTVSVLIDDVPVASFTNRKGSGDTQD